MSVISKATREYYSLPRSSSFALRARFFSRAARCSLELSSEGVAHTHERVCTCVPVILDDYTVRLSFIEVEGLNLAP